MANVTVPNVAKAKMAAARAGKITLPAITKIALGDGGVDSDGNVITPLPTVTALNNELIRATITSIEKVSDTQYKYGYRMEEGALDGGTVSEVALIDSEGDLATIENFKPRGDDLSTVFYVIDDFT